MERTYRLIEQLDLALDQLAIGTPTASRLALILTDNVVELILHTSCVTEIRLDDSGGSWLPRKYDAKAREAVGNTFAPKVEFCAALGILARDEAEFIRAVHGYRNDLYHAGVQYDPIILPLAWEYFDVTTRLLPKMRVPAHLMVHPQSKQVAGYFSADLWDAVPQDRIATAGQKLRELRPSLPDTFQKMLSDFALELVEEVENNLDFLTSDNPDRMGEADVLREIQLLHHAFATADKAPGGTGTLSRRSVLQRIGDLRKQFTPKYRTSPVQRWKRRAESIARKPDAYSALASFQSFRASTDDFRAMLREAAEGLEAHLQLEMDHYRLASHARSSHQG